MDLDKLRKMNRDLSTMHTELHDEILAMEPMSEECGLLVDLSSDIYDAITVSGEIIMRKLRTRHLS